MRNPFRAEARMERRIADVSLEQATFRTLVIQDRDAIRASLMQIHEALSAIRADTAFLRVSLTQGVEVVSEVVEA